MSSEQQIDYGEPIRFDTDCIRHRDGSFLMLACTCHGPRAVAAVNACRGIPDSELSGLRVKELLDYLTKISTDDMPEEKSLQLVAAKRAIAKRALAVAKGDGQ